MYCITFEINKYKNCVYCIFSPKKHPLPSILFFSNTIKLNLSSSHSVVECSLQQLKNSINMTSEFEVLFIVPSEDEDSESESDFDIKSESDEIVDLTIDEESQASECSTPCPHTFNNNNNSNNGNGENVDNVENENRENQARETQSAEAAENPPRENQNTQNQTRENQNVNVIESELYSLAFDIKIILDSFSLAREYFF